MKYGLVFILFFAACASKPKLRYPEINSSNECHIILSRSENLSADQQLNLISDLFANQCFHEVIALGDYIRSFHRDKFYKSTTETIELFIPEGTVTEYVMESYERGYLSLLLSISYLKLKNEERGVVELRKANQELSAQLYNYGKDAITIMLLASLWDRFDSTVSRPHWKYLSELPIGKKNSVDEIILFAKKRIDRMDRFPSELIKWNIRGFGELPSLTWKSDFISRKKGPYRIYARDEFPQSCHEDEAIFASTESWVDKISHRYDNEYHPFLYTKSLLRAPIGVGYGVLGVTAGVAVGATGCIVAGGISSKISSESSAELCEMSFELAGNIIHSSSDFVEYILKPDLRHWKKLPRAIMISKNQENVNSSCHKIQSRWIESVNYNF